MSGSDELRGIERRQLLSYAAPARSDALAALLALDDTLGAILQGTRQPMIGQMRLTWWHDALTALDVADSPAQPVLRALAEAVVPILSGALLAAMVEGWEELLDPEPLDDARLARFAEMRGGRLFAAAGRVLGSAPGDPLAAAGAGWALADLAAHVGDAETVARARTLARPLLTAATSVRWSRAGRPLGALAHWATQPDASPPARAARGLWHRLTGR